MTPTDFSEVVVPSPPRSPGRRRPRRQPTWTSLFMSPADRRREERHEEACGACGNRRGWQAWEKKFHY